jgi:predicted TIM-barrel fold metal-dependent hydrolase
MALVQAAAGCSNVFIKYSGMGNVAAPDQEYPYTDLQAIPRALATTFGAERMVWGSDYPVSRRYMTYRQALSLLTRHGPFEAEERQLVLGGNMLRLIEERAGNAS